MQPSQITIPLTQQDLQELGRLIDELPYKYAVGIISFIAAKQQEAQRAMAQVMAGKHADGPLQPARPNGGVEAP